MFQGPLNPCVHGDAQIAAAYAQDRVLPALNTAMTAVCVDKSEAPLKRIQKILRGESELRSLRTSEVRVAMPPQPTPEIAAAANIALDNSLITGSGTSVSARGGPSSSRPPTERQSDPGTGAIEASTPAPRVTTAGSCTLDLKFESRPCLLTKPKDHLNTTDGSAADSSLKSIVAPPAVVLPRSFYRCGEHPVYCSEVPTRSLLQTIAKFIRETDGFKHITWLLVSTEATPLLFMGEQPYKCKIPTAVWAGLKEDCHAIGFRSKFTSPIKAAIPGASLGVGGSDPQQRITPSTTPRTSRNKSKAVTAAVPIAQSLPLDDAALEQLLLAEVSTAVGRKGNAVSVVDVLRSITQVPAPSSTPSANATLAVPGSHAAAQASRETKAAEVSGAAAIYRLYHPADVPVSKQFVDVLFAVLSEVSQREPQAAVVVLSVDQATLMQHVAVLSCLFFRTKHETFLWKQTLNATERLRDRSYVYDYDKITNELHVERDSRDETRRMLREAQMKGFEESGLTQSAREFQAKWEELQAWHRNRREAEDERRSSLNFAQDFDAAKRVQSIIRGVMTRKRTCGVFKKLRSEMSDFEGPYRRGRYPLIDGTMEYLEFVFGPKVVTSEAMKRGSTKTATRWKRSKSRIPPQADFDISSEEEEWTEETFEKLQNEGSGALNPLHLVDFAMGGARTLDKDILYEAFVNYPGVSCVQEKALRSLERMVHYLMVCIFWASRHRVREGNSSDSGPYASMNLLDLPLKLKNCESYHHFTALYRRPQEWLSHPQFSLPLLSNIPRPLQTSRVLVANPSAPNGCGVEPLGRADPFLFPSSPIFLVPDGSTIDQMAESVLAVQRQSLRCKKVLWLTFNPNFTLYINGVPFYFLERRKAMEYDSPQTAALAHVAPPLVSTVVVRRNDNAVPVATTALSNTEAIVVEPSDDSEKRASAAASGKPTTLSPFALSQPAANAVAGRTPRSGSTSVRVEAGSPGVSAMTKSSTRRPSTIVTEAGTPTPLKKYEAGWYGVSWDNIELHLCDELIQRIDDPRADGILKCFSASTTAGRLSATAWPLWNHHQIDTRRFEKCRVAQFEVRVTQQPLPIPHSSHASRSSRSTSQAITPRTSLSNAPPPASTGAPAGGSTTTATHFSLSVATSPPRPEVSPLRHPGAAGSGGLSARSLSIESGGSSTAATRRSRRLGNRRSSMSSRKSSERGDESSANDPGREEEPLPPPYPTNARDALRTPLQAVEDAKEKIRASSECSLIYRRLPMLQPFGDEWLKNLDAVLTSFRDILADTSASIAVCVSTPDSVFYALFGAILWEVELKKVAPRKAAPLARGSPPPTSGTSAVCSPLKNEATNPPLDESNSEDAALAAHNPFGGNQKDGRGPAAGGDGGGASQSFEALPKSPPGSPDAAPSSTLSPRLTSTPAPTTLTAIPGAPPPLAACAPLPLTEADLRAPLLAFPGLEAMGDDVPQLKIEASVAGVVEILHKTNTKSIIYDCILELMDAAEEARNASAFDAAKRHALEAVVAYEKFVLLVAFHSFLLNQFEDAASLQQQSLAQRLSHHRANHQKQTSYFRDFVLNTPLLYHRLHHADPWERNPARRAPLGVPPSFAFVAAMPSGAQVEGCWSSCPAALDGDARWRSDVLIPDFS